MPPWALLVVLCGIAFPDLAAAKECDQNQAWGQQTAACHVGEPVVFGGRRLQDPPGTLEVRVAATLGLTGDKATTSAHVYRAFQLFAARVNSDGFPVFLWRQKCNSLFVQYVFI